MFEMTPSFPYSTKCDFREIIKSIREKYHILHSKPRIALTIPSVPLLGLRNSKNEEKFVNDITKSRYISDNHIADHIRFRTLTRNIRKRRGRTVEMLVPIYKDTNTSLEELAQTEPNP